MFPKYNLDKIKFATDRPTLQKAIDLYENCKVKQFKTELNGFFATVLGTKPYKVYVDNRHYDIGDCECYIGQNDMLCKHMVAVAIYAVMDGKKLAEEHKQIISQAKCSIRLGKLSKEEFTKINKAITDAIKYIKPYNGPSRIWFAYQNSLSEGCNRLSKIVSELPVNEQTAELLIKTLLRLDDKLCSSGVDDSDGTVGGLMEEIVIVLQAYAKLDAGCVKAFHALRDKKTCFGWEEPLLSTIS